MRNVDKWDIYVCFRTAQANFRSKPYRLPKDWEGHFLRMSLVNQNAIIIATGNFNTIWKNINVNKFMTLGFELFGKNFTYTKFKNDKLLKFYIEKDKQEKRSIRVNKKKIIDSAKFIKNKVGGVGVVNGYNTFQIYCKRKDSGQRMVISDYLHGDIDNYLMTYFISEMFFVLTDGEREQLTYIVGRYREFCDRLVKIKPFIKKVEREL